MKKNSHIIHVFIIILLSGCGAPVTSQPIIPTLIFFTPTAPLEDTPQPIVQPQVLSNPTATLIPIEGTTTTQLNLRSEPSTTGDTLSLIPAFAKVKIIGKEINGAWYQIQYADLMGWVTATYVQVDASAAIPVIETEAGLGSSVSGIILQGVNVRNGPGTTYDSLGTLIQNDVVTITGKDTSGSWIQIKYKNQAGWVAAEFIKLNSADNLPVMAEETKAASPQATAGANPSENSAIEDNDSIETPSASAMLTSEDIRALQFNGVVSSPNGDAVDWIQFTTSGGKIYIYMECSESNTTADLFIDKQPLTSNFLMCGEKKNLNTSSGLIYTIRVSSNQGSAPTISHYSLKLEVVQ